MRRCVNDVYMVTEYLYLLSPVRRRKALTILVKWKARSAAPGVGPAGKNRPQAALGGSCAITSLPRSVGYIRLGSADTQLARGTLGRGISAAGEEPDADSLRCASIWS